MMFSQKMAFQRFACVLTVTIILLCKGYDSQQPVCGKAVLNTKIVGGQNASPGSWPWHVVFKSLGSIFCQGSLITNQWVLTTAYCSMRRDLNGSVVHLGVYNQSGFNPNEVTRRVENFICHQNFSSYTYENDICLVKLSAPVNFTDYIQPVCLAAENSTFYDGTPSWVTGFGYNKTWFQPEILQEVDVPIIGNNKCTCLYNNSYTYLYKLTQAKLCAGQKDGSKETFYNDEGAALVAKKGSAWVQSGILSSVYQDWLKTPSIYTRVSQYQKWISDRVTGMKPGFVNFTSQGMDPDLYYTCPTSAPTTPYHFFTYFFSTTTTTKTATTTTTTKPATTTTTTKPATTTTTTKPATTTTTTTTPSSELDFYPDDSVFNNGQNLTPHPSSLSVFLACFSMALLAIVESY